MIDVLGILGKLVPFIVVIVEGKSLHREFALFERGRGNTRPEMEMEENDDDGARDGETAGEADGADGEKEPSTSPKTGGKGASKAGVMTQAMVDAIKDAKTTQQGSADRQ